MRRLVFFGSCIWVTGLSVEKWHMGGVGCLKWYMGGVLCFGEWVCGFLCSAWRIGWWFSLGFSRIVDCDLVGGRPDTSGDHNVNV